MSARPPESTPRRLALHRDPVWAIGVAGLSSLLFASTFSSAVGGGDAPESVAGIHSLGILHAPGYPSYVLLGRIFTVLVPIGDTAFRVNLFSTACAIGAVVLSFYLGRAIGAPRPAAALGALALASATSFWFYANFAKFYALSWLLLLAVALLVVRWVERGALWRLATAAVLFGLVTGASYQVAVLALPGFVAAIVLSSRPGRWTGLATAAGVAALTSVILWGFVLLRARQDPAMAWGAPDSFHRLVDLVSMRDFGWGSAALSSVDGRAARVGIDAESLLGKLPRRTGRYLVLFTREFSVLVVATAAVGVVASWRRLSRPVAAMLITVFVTNLLGALVAVGMGTPRGFTSGLRYGGFLLAASFVTATWVAVGAWAAADACVRWFDERAQAGPRRERASRVATARRRSTAVLALGAAALVLPPAVAHWRAARHRGPVVATYASDVLATVADDAVLVVWGAEAAFPFQYAQIVEGERPDVDVVMGDVLSAPWYREQVEGDLGIDLPKNGGGVTLSRELIAAVGERPVFLDLGASAALAQVVRARPIGMANEVIPGQPGIAPVDIEAHRRVVYEDLHPELAARAGDRWPYEQILVAYVNAHFDLAKAYSAEGRRDDVRGELEAVLRLDPDNDIARHDLGVLRGARS